MLNILPPEKITAACSMSSGGTRVQGTFLPYPPYAPTCVVHLETRLNSVPVLSECKNSFLPIHWGGARYPWEWQGGDGAGPPMLPVTAHQTGLEHRREQVPPMARELLCSPWDRQLDLTISKRININSDAFVCTVLHSSL